MFLVFVFLRLKDSFKVSTSIESSAPQPTCDIERAKWRVLLARHGAHRGGPGSAPAPDARPLPDLPEASPDPGGQARALAALGVPPGRLPAIGADRRALLVARVQTALKPETETGDVLIPVSRRL